MIPVNCRTNLDIHPSEQWPKFLPARPVIGDRIEAVSGLQLEVVGVTFVCYNKDGYLANKDWEMSVELNIKSGWTVTEFEKWYERFKKG